MVEAEKPGLETRLFCRLGPISRLLTKKVEHSRTYWFDNFLGTLFCLPREKNEFFVPTYLRS